MLAHQRTKAAEADDSATGSRRGLSPGPLGGSRRGPPSNSNARLLLYAAMLILLGYAAGALHYRCTGGASGSSRSIVSQLVAAVSGSGGPAHDDAGGSGAPRAAAAGATGANLAVLETGELPPANRTLRFPVCNGFANQRLAVLYGIILAKRLGRAAVLPVLIDNGLQRTDTNVLASTSNQLAFEDMYDLPYFTASMARVGVRVLTPDEAPPANTILKLASIRGSVPDALMVTYGNIRHVAIDCPLFKLSPADLTPRDEALVWAVLGGMRPSKEAAALVDLVSRAISSKAASAATTAAAAAAGAGVLTAAGGVVGGGQVARSRSLASTAAADATFGPAQAFNYIHLRVENDWIEHCKRWESIRDGVVRDNCYRNTDTVEAQLALFGFSNSSPLYVASYWDDVEPARREQIMARLRAAGFTLVTSSEVFPAGGSLEGRGREYRAMLEYFVGLRSQRFIGNSVSTFAALGIMERRHAGRWAGYYNGGNIPLASVMPLLHRLPWVFTYNSWSAQYDYMLKGAVRSALATGSLQPYCIFMGNGSSAIHSWLVAHNVTVISHEPRWREQLLAMAGRKAQDNVHHSHLYKSVDTLVSTFQRVDLPVVPLLDQYTYVLFTDADVFFRRPIHLDDFSLPLPRSVSMSYEMDPMFPYNAGVIVANLPVMRQNYDAFIAMMLDNGDGLYYNGFGPADQGIINKFYEKDLRGRMLNQLFNAKPYSTFDTSAFIVHFHGPKPHEYAAYVTTGLCDFKGLCEKAFASSLCRYTREWAQWVPEEPVAVRLMDACGLLDNPAFKRLRGASGTAR